MYDDAVAILTSKGRVHLILCIDKALLEQTVYFLGEFRHATLALEAWRAPTIHLVIFWKWRLLYQFDQPHQKKDWRADC